MASGLKQHIVIVNEFTTKTSKGGTRGGSPGQYVTRYMARERATETLAPIRYEDTDSYIVRYMARQEATEKLSTVPAVKKDMRDAQGYGGVAFGYGDVSLSDAKLKSASKDIQRCFDSGKTVLKTVISFDEDYLRQHNLVSDDFEFRNRGDYRGHIDQMKLRMAIMHGLEFLGRKYDDLQYVGVIQVDTAHVHCHLAMVDRGVGKSKINGMQRGKITESGKRALRRGIDLYLDEQKTLQMMAASVGYDKQNVVSFVKKFTHKLMAAHGTPQFLLSCLPDDKRLWRASTNRKDMKKPNAIVRQMVSEMLAEPDSGYRDALKKIDEYARSRVSREGLTGKEYRMFVDNGRQKLIEDCMNSVYSVMKQIPESDRRVWTPMLSAMSMSYEEMAAETSDPMIEFGFRLRSYSSRLQHHKKETVKYHDLRKSYENTVQTVADSKPLYDFFRFEEDYNSKLMCKYQHFLSFLPPDESYEDGFENLMQYKSRVRRMEMMISDKSMPKMQSQNAERYGEKVYDLKGGQYTVIGPDVLETRLLAMRKRYEEMEEDFKYRLSKSGYSLDDRGVSTKKPYAFDDVKALDIHHLGYDWSYDTDIAIINVNEFVGVADERYKLFQSAKQYLVLSGQEAALSQLPEKDIMYMHEVADSMRIDPVLKSNVAGSGQKRKNKTIRLDNDITSEIRSAVRDVVVHSDMTQ